MAESGRIHPGLSAEVTAGLVMLRRRFFVVGLAWLILACTIFACSKPVIYSNHVLFSFVYLYLFKVNFSKNFSFFGIFKL